MIHQTGPARMHAEKSAGFGMTSRDFFALAKFPTRPGPLAFSVWLSYLITWPLSPYHDAERRSDGTVEISDFSPDPNGALNLPSVTCWGDKRNHRRSLRSCSACSWPTERMTSSWDCFHRAFYTTQSETVVLITLTDHIRKHRFYSISHLRQA